MEDSNKDNEKRGTSGMPEPEPAYYLASYVVTPQLRKDLEIVLKDYAYADASPIFEYLDKYESDFTAALVSEFVNMLRELPYARIRPMMKIIEKPDGLSRYFVKREIPEPRRQPMPADVVAQDGRKNEGRDA